MSPKVQKVLGQAIVRLINGEKKAAAELSKQAHFMWYKENHLTATIAEIIKNKRRIS